MVDDKKIAMTPAVEISYLKPEVDKIVLTSDTLRKYFPRSYTPKQMQDTIIKLLDQWLKKRQRQQER